MTEAEDESQFWRAFEEGVSLFNEARFFESHEVWERLWLETGDADRAQVLKGLLQAAIAVHHFRRHNLEGARKLYEGQRRILAPYLPASLGVDLEALAREMEACCSALGSVRPGEAPQLDPAKIPKIRRRPT